MSWEKIIKAPPPRPPNEDDIPRQGKYFGPRWVLSGPDITPENVAQVKRMRIKGDFEAFTVNAKSFILYEDLSFMNPEDIIRRIEADIGEGKVKWYDGALEDMEGYLASTVLEVYEQMMDDIYDDFEVWSAYGGFKLFEQTYHQESRVSQRGRFGGDLYHSAEKIDEWKEMAQNLMNSKFPAINARIRTTITNLVNGLNQLKRRPIRVLKPTAFLSDYFKIE